MSRDMLWYYDKAVQFGTVSGNIVLYTVAE